MNNSLYELTSKYDYLLNCLYDDEFDESTLIDTLDGIEGEIEEKAENYAKVMRQLELSVAAYKAEEERMAQKRKTLENRITKLKTALYNSMKTCGKTKFKAGVFSFGIQKNPPSLVLDTQPDNIPKDYMIPQPDKVDSFKIKKALQAGEKLDFAHLEQGESLRIR